MPAKQPTHSTDGAPDKTLGSSTTQSLIADCAGLEDHEVLERIVEHFTQRIREGKLPSIAEYQDRFPGLRDDIEPLLSSVAMIEQLKSGDEAPASKRPALDQVSDLKRIGNYRVVRELGRGGMGIVFEAIHDELGRRVAIKVMPTPLMEGSNYIERFKREAQAAAKLHHTNIVSVFGVGKGPGFYYYVMDLVDGLGLNEVIFRLGNNPDDTLVQRRAQPVDVTQTDVSGYAEAETLEFQVDPNRLQQEIADATPVTDFAPTIDKTHFIWAAKMGASIADALAYAHETKILHRDIKPSNLMLDRKGVVWVTDFGLAKDTADEVNLTKTGDVIGTPQYLAPESLEGKYDHLSEIYCLGLTLYELVTFLPAYASGTTAEVIRAIATTTPTSPRKVASNVPRDLSLIIDKAISREPTDRYASAAALRDDLLAFANDLPIAARQPSLLERTVRWSRKNPLVAALSALSLLMLTMVAVVASIGYVVTMNALNKEAEKSTRLAAQQLLTERARKEAETNLSSMKVQYNRAESNVAISINAFDELFDVVLQGGNANELELDGFGDVAGVGASLTKQDADLLDRLLPYYQKFASLNEGNQQLQAESARAFRRVGNIYHLVGEADQAIAAYQKSLELYQSVWAQIDAEQELTPDQRDAMRKQALLDRVRLQNELGAVYRQNQNTFQAQTLNRDSIQLLDSSPLSKFDADIQLELARSLSLTGTNVLQFAATNRGDGPKGGNPSFSRNPNGSRNLLDRLGWGGNSSSDRQRKDGPMRSDSLRFRYQRVIERAIEIVDGLLKQDPNNREYRSVKATCLCVLAAIEIIADRETGNKKRNEAIAELESLIEDSPEHSEYRYYLALTYSFRNPESDQQDLAMIEKAVAIADELTEQFPSRIDHHQLLVTTRLKLANIQIADRNSDAALKTIEATSPSFEFLIDRSSNNMASRAMFGSLKQSLSKLERLLRDEGERWKATQISTLLRKINDKAREKGMRRPGGRRRGAE